ncbi:MAG: peptidylprolyl isomerase [Gammaproteobacteria bacterium]|nr:peptidylprolyl isomerase [Gammaproteobacteria bacterium]MDH5593615.1 peptidylprolyl isomerase [Gammaproteobacteria bacterium]
MQVTENTVVTIDYTLKDDDGNVIDSSEGKEGLSYLHGAQNIIAGLENALAGKAVGDSLQVSIPPEEGYGVHDESKIQPVPKEMFDGAGEIAVGMDYYAQGPNGETLTITVVEVTDEHVVVDGNHPLAGKNLNFDVSVTEIREASAEELEHGHVHGPGGHHHE